VKIYLRTLDVLHSFYLPNLRLKQDALPGKTIPMWFRATASNTVRSDLPNEWLGNKDPQLWKDELSQIQRLKEESTKKEKLAQKEKGDAKKQLEAEITELQAEMSKIRSRTHSGQSWEIACAELCGARHAYMRGRLYVHPTREDFAAWLAHAYRQQRGRQP
jgi:cytochrome c oxidase subunit 2